MALAPEYAGGGVGRLVVRVVLASPAAVVAVGIAAFML